MKVIIKFNLSPSCLVHFDYAIDLSDEPEAGKEADRPGEEEEKEHHD